MKNIRSEIPELGGMYEAFPAHPDTCIELVNYTIDQYTKGWSNKIGYERYFPQPGLKFQPFSGVTMKRAQSMFIWDRHSGAQEIVLVESGGKLYYLHDIYTGAAQPELKELSVGRTTAAPNEAPTQYTPFGRWLVITNGYDAPLRYGGWPVPQSGVNPWLPPLYPLGWTERPLPPFGWQDVTKFNAALVSIEFSRENGVGVFFRKEENDGGQSKNNLGSCDAYDMGIGFINDEVDGPVTGGATEGSHNSFRYRISFVSNSGSEGPLSEPSNVVQWKKLKTSSDFNRYAIYLNIPTGPDGTVARRLYRTKNFGESGSGTETDFYFVDEIRNNTDTDYYDVYSSSNLGSLAPSNSDSIPIPSTTIRFSESYQNCLFIDGGSENDTVLYYSNPGKPDQFTGLGFIDLGNRRGGAITALHSYFNVLFVFRESAIYAVDGTWPNFQARMVTANIGTQAINTITNVPGIGILFLAQDGVYAISGNMEYSDTPNVVKVSDSILKTTRRINPDCIARASAAYSHRKREWHCYFPADGEPKANVGLVYHLDKTAWSVREGFPVGCIQADRNGNLIFGHHTGMVGGAVQTGLFAISARRSLGQNIVDDEIQDLAPPQSKFRSAWLDMGDATLKKKVHFVYLYVLTQGNNPIALTYYKDFTYTGTEVLGRELQRPEYPDQSVYNTVTVTTGSSTPWEEPFVTTVRFPVAISSCSWFQFGLKTTNDITIIGYSVEYTGHGTRTIAGKLS